MRIALGDLEMSLFLKIIIRCFYLFIKMIPLMNFIKLYLVWVTAYTSKLSTITF